MERQVFKSNILVAILPLIVATIVVLILYNTTKNKLVLLVLLVFILGFIISLKSKLVIENGNLRFEKLIRTKEVYLENVSQIILEELESTDSDGNTSTKTNMNVFDKAGHIAFEFPIKYINKTIDQERFIETVHSYNPAIEFSFETNYDRQKIVFNEFKKYRKSKKEEKRKAKEERR